MDGTSSATAEKVTEQFLAVNPVGGGGYWGTGDTIDDAKKALKGAGGRLDRYVVYRMPAGATEVHVDGLGRMAWTWTDGADTEVKPEIVVSRGLPKG
jgi:hypothetical protein